MTTSYSEIYSRFFNKITDYDLSSLVQEDAEAVALEFLKSAIPKFLECGEDLTNRDDTAEEFDFDLSELEQEILSCLMVTEWVDTKLNTTEILEQNLGSRDFRMYSPANLLDQLRQLKKDKILEAGNLVNQYTYYNGDLSDFS